MKEFQENNFILKDFYTKTIKYVITFFKKVAHNKEDFRKNTYKLSIAYNKYIYISW